MVYKILEKDGGYDLLETNNMPPIKLGHYDTEDKAGKARDQWKAKDKIIDRIEIFIDSNVAEFSEILDGDEIRQMIVDNARV